MIPTSLGNRGSLLRPAVFESKESRTAPFLISLPFLLHCQAILHLDPSKGLRIHFKKFGFTVRCHLGPTGALRVPLSQFTKENLSCVMQAQEQLKAHHQEFEVLKTTIETGENSGPSEPGLDCPDPCDQREPHSTSHGVSQQPQEGPGDRQRGSRTDAGMASIDPQDLPGDGTGDQSDHQPRVPQASQGTVLSVAPLQDSGGGVFRCGERGQLPGDRRGDGAPIPEVLIGDTIPGITCTEPEVGGQQLLDGGRLHDDGGSTELSTRTTSQVVRDQEAGSELWSDILAMPAGSSGSMPLLCMDAVSTDVAHRTRTRSTPRSVEIADEGVSERIGTKESRDYVNGQFHVEGNYLSPSEDPEIGKQRQGTPCDLRGLRQDSVEGEGGEVRERERTDHEEPSPDNPGLGGVCRVPGVPPLAEGSVGRVQIFEEVGLTEEEFRHLSKPTSGRKIKRLNRVTCQARAALSSAEEVWKELMNLICTEPSQLEERGWQNFWTAAADPKDQTRVTNRKAMHKYGSLLGRDRNSMKTVAEVYNPERFGKQAEKV